MNQSDLQDLPEDVRAAISGRDVRRSEELQALGQKIAKMRDEAINARKESGIEATWTECEEAYIGIDDENRAEFAGARWAKPMSMDGGLRRVNSSDGVRATAFVKITSRYVDAGSAKVCEIALPVDGQPFTLKATPVPELSALAEDDTPAQDVTGQPMPGPDGQPVAVKDLAKHQMSKAEKKAKKAATRIHDWMVEYKHGAEMRKVIFDSARLGAGIIKGPIPEESKAIAIKRSERGVTVEMVSNVKPVARWVDPWRFFPAPGCGEDIKRGGWCFEMDTMLPHELLELGRGEATQFLPDAIDTVVAQGPGKCNLDEYGNTSAITTTDKSKAPVFEVWHFYGLIARQAFEAANVDQLSEIEQYRDQVPAIVTIVNDVVIRAVLQPLHSGRIPYHVFNWRRRAGFWAGVGVAEQVRAPQRIVNAAWRRLLNNAGQSSGSQVVMDPNAVEPANKDWTIVPDKLWWLRKDAGIDDVRKVFAAFQWPNTTAQVLSIIEAGYRLAEEHTSIPLITQGQSGDTTPDTFGGQQLQDNNANQLLRDIGAGLNDQITTPLVDMFYEVLLTDPDVPDDEKGDFKVDTSGALAIIEKKLNDMFLPQMLGMSKDPAFGWNPEKVAEELLRSKRMSPAMFSYTEEEKERMRQAPPPKAPAVEAAEIRARSAEAIAQSRDALAAQRNQNDLDRDAVYNDVLAGREAANYDYNLRRLELERELAALKYASEQRISLQDAKVALARDTMKLRLQAELSKDGSGPQVATPALEPEGRAPQGQAFEK